MSVLFQDIVVTSITLAIAIGAIVRVVRWTRPTAQPGCSNCSGCENRTSSSNGARRSVVAADSPRVAR